MIGKIHEENVVLFDTTRYIDHQWNMSSIIIISSTDIANKLKWKHKNLDSILKKRHIL